MCPFTGTHASDLFKLISDSGSNFEAIPLSLFRDEDSRAVLIGLLLKHGEVINLVPPTVMNSIRCLGGNPRFLSIFLQFAMMRFDDPFFFGQLDRISSYFTQ